MLVREEMRNCANGRCCHLSLWVVQESEKINTRHWYCCRPCGQCVHLLLCEHVIFVFFQFCCFALLPTATPNLSHLPLFSAEFTTHHGYFISSGCVGKGSTQGQTDTGEISAVHTLKHTNAEAE